MAVRKPRPVEEAPLEPWDAPLPEPGPGEVRVRVEYCGVCRTDLHVVEGDLPAHRDVVIPGHEVIGTVEAHGPGVDAPPLGARVGVAWLHRTCGRCRFCSRGAENLCLEPRFTGWDVHGGYAEFVVAPADFVLPLPAGLDPRASAPLLCAGIIGYRAWRRTGLGRGGRLGLFGFGGSAHIVIQIARQHGSEVFVFSRSERHRELARELGAAWVGDTQEAPPAALGAAILFAPAGDLVPTALETLDRGGVLAVAGIHLSEIPRLDYQRHLFHERELRSVTANTRHDAQALLELAVEIPIETRTTLYPLERAGEALHDLKHDRIRGAAVLEVAAGER